MKRKISMIYDTISWCQLINYLATFCNQTSMPVCNDSHQMKAYSVTADCKI